MIEHNGVILSGFDQEKWVQWGGYGAWKIQDAMEMFRLLREANVRMLERLSPAEWECTGNHVERGRLTVRGLARHMAAHDINHMKQIEGLRAWARSLGTSTEVDG
jgi:uncharacterized damage-inducible protein DinB